MKAKNLVIVLVGVLAVSAVSASLLSAKPDGPEQAQGLTKSGRPQKLREITFVHPIAPDKPGKPDVPPGQEKKKDEEPVDNTYYERWGGRLAATAEYRINADSSPVASADVIAALNASADSWDAVTALELLVYGGTTSETWLNQDGQNTVSWVKFLPRDYIAMVRMWYDENTMIIHEFDIVFNAFHKWGVDPVKEDKDKIRAFDIQNIATHEFGHPVGLDDLYDSPYRELTMYGYSSKGETQKCSLEEGDISGAQELYDEP